MAAGTHALAETVGSERYLDAAVPDRVGRIDR